LNSLSLSNSAIRSPVILLGYIHSITYQDTH
jgi:hypothetical protein